MTNLILCILLGIIAGFISGLIGIGGGVIIVPALILFFGLSQHEAQGTTLALLVPPISILGAWTYYQRGYVDIGIAIYVCFGFLLGSLLGAKVATDLSTIILERFFGGAMLVIAIKMLLGR